MKRNLLTTINLTFVLFCFLVSAAHAQVTLKVTPAAIGPDYTGNLTVQIAGLTNGETVKLGRFVDANANGVVDAPDVRVMGVTLRDGQAQVIAGVTNINVPIDYDPAGGSMTIQLSQSATGFEQKMPGQHIFRLISPSDRFSPVDAPLTVTNAGFGQGISGTVTSGGTAVPYSWIVLFQSGWQDLSYPVWSGVADGNGHYSLKVPMGSYSVMAAMSNYVADLASMASVTVGPGAAVTANLNLIPATTSISGGLVDSVHSNNAFTAIGIAAVSSDNKFAFGLTGTNGTFSIPVTAGMWNLSVDERNDVAMFRYLRPSETSVDASSGSVSGMSIEMTRVSALIYGVLKDAGGNPLPGVRINADNNGEKGLGLTDQAGNFTIGVTGGTWNLSPDDQNPALSGYIIAGLDMVTIADGQAFRRDLTALQAGHQISGSLKDGNGGPLSGVSIWGNATVNGAQLYVNGQTDSQGYFSMAVPSGEWTVGVSNGGNDGGLDPSYLTPPSQVVNVANNDVAVNFVALIPSAFISGVLMGEDGAPIPGIWINAASNFNGGQVFYGAITDGNGNYSFGVPRGTWNVVPNCFGDNQSLNGLGYECVNSQGVSVSNVNVTVNFSVPKCHGPNMTVTILPDGFVGVNYSMDLYATGCYMPFSWALAPNSAPLPAGLQLSAGGFLSGIPSASGHFTFQVQITDSMGNPGTTNLSMTVRPPAQAPKFTSASMGDGRFVMQLTGGGSQVYNVQYCTNLGSTNWLSLLVTNSPTSSFSITDFSATNGQRFYRVKVSP